MYTYSGMVEVVDIALKGTFSQSTQALKGPPLVATVQVGHGDE